MPGLEIKRGAIAWAWVRVLGVGEGSRQSKQKRHPETTPEGPFRGAGPEEDSQADRVASVPHQENASRTGKGDKGREKKSGAFTEMETKAASIQTCHRSDMTKEN